MAALSNIGRVFVLAMLMTSPRAYAQSASGVTTYFLIDASGSMRNKLGVAESEVKKKLDGIVAVNPQVPVSRTYFGGGNGGTCGSRISIGAKVAAADSKPQQPAPENDSSQIGAALEAAILNAENNPADIYIITDGDQTSSCGIDICIAAETYLPRPGVNVQFVPIDPKPSDQDRLGCIAGAQLEKKNSLASPSKRTQELEEREWWNDKNVLPKSFWILSLLSFLASALLLGFHFGKAAHEHEQKIQKYDASANSSDVKYSKRLLWLGLLPLAIGLALSFLIWLCPAEMFVIAKGEANTNLNSQFGSSLFLAGALSFIGFSASQYWRFLEARREFYVVSNRAAADEATRENKKNERLYDDYRRKRQAAVSHDFKYDIDQVVRQLGLNENDKPILSGVAAGLMQVAIGPELTFGKIKQSDIELLGKLQPGWMPPNLTTYVAARSGREAEEFSKLLTSQQKEDPETLRKKLQAMLSELNATITKAANPGTN